KALILAIGQGHRGGDGDRIPGMNAHRIEVLDGADDSVVVCTIANDLELVFLPTEEALFDEAFVNGAALEGPADRLIELAAVVDGATARAAHRQRWAQNEWKADLIGDAMGIFDGARDAGLGALEADPIHRVFEEFSLFGLADRLHL